MMTGSRLFAAAWSVSLSGLALAAGASAQVAADNDVLSEQKISATAGGLTSVLADGDQFGRSVTRLGDLDGDGVDDLAVGAPSLPVLGPDAGSVWILFMNSNGTVKDRQEIGDGVGGFTGSIDPGDSFGGAVAGLGDLDGDTVPDLAVGAPFDPGDGISARGSVWVLFLDTDGTVKSHVRISDVPGMTGGFTGTLDDNDTFGYSLSTLGAIGSPSTDLALAVGAPGDDDGVGLANAGAVWVVFLDATGNVVAAKTQKISAVSGGFGGTLASTDSFGVAVAAVGDLDGSGLGVVGLAVGAPGVHMFPFETREGTVWMLLLDSTGAVIGETAVTEGSGGFPDTLDPGDQFGSALAAIELEDGNVAKELAVGAIFDDAAGGTGRGAFWVLCFKNDATVSTAKKISSGLGGFTGVLDDDDFFGGSLAALRDLDGAGGPDLAVGAFLDDDGGPDRGALYGLFLDDDPAPPAPLIYGCNPAGTVSTSGGTGFGDTITITFDNPLGTQNCALVIPSLSAFQLQDCGIFCPDAGCGVPLGPGFDMTGTGVDGYLSVGTVIVTSIVGIVGLPLISPEWTPGNPVSLDIEIPYDCSLVGGFLHVQAAFWEAAPFPPPPDPPLFGCTPAQSPPVRFGMTQAVRFQVGS